MKTKIIKDESVMITDFKELELRSIASIIELLKDAPCTCNAFTRGGRHLENCYRERAVRMLVGRG